MLGTGVLSNWGHEKEGMGMGLSYHVDVASCANVVGTEGETVVDCRRYGLEFVDG